VFSVEVEPITQAVVLSLRGELDFDSTVQLDEAADRLLSGEDGQPALVIVNCTDLYFCDSSGIGCFVRMYQRLTARSGELRIAAAPAPVTRAFSLTGLDQVIGVYATMDAALASGSGGYGAGTGAGLPPVSSSAEG